MKLRRSDVRRQAHALPVIKFENHALTSFAGLVLFQSLFAALNLKERLRGCFRHLSGGKAFGPATIVLQLIVHLLLGFRELRDSRAYRDDPMVQRLLGLKRLPDVATVSRMLKNADPKSVDHLRRLLGEMLFERLATLGLARITLDFDGSVQSTRRHRRRLQQKAKGRPQLLPPLLHHRPDRPGARLPAPFRQRPRLARGPGAGHTHLNHLVDE